MPTPLPKQIVIPPKTRDVARMYNGVMLHSTLDAQPGRQASLERETPDSYALDLQLRIKVPTAAHAAAEITHSAPDLLTAFPKLTSILDKAEVSKFFFGIYQNKTEVLRQNLTHLDALLSRDVFYDTDTILELQDPDTQRKALLVQSDMDVDSDGSDADRLLDIDTTDPHFQPLTSYKWPRRTAAVNPLLPIYRDRLARLEADARSTPAPRRSTQAAIEALRNDVYQLEHYSSLIARTDPFIVLPGFMARANGHPFQPKLGDYAVVLANGKLYPAIFGDIGPSDRAGEASLRLAQAVDPVPRRSAVPSTTSRSRTSSSPTPPTNLPVPRISARFVSVARLSSTKSAAANSISSTGQTSSRRRLLRPRRLQLPCRHLPPLPACHLFLARAPRGPARRCPRPPSPSRRLLPRRKCLPRPRPPRRARRGRVSRSR